MAAKKTNGNGGGTTEEAQKIVTTRAKRSYLKQTDVPKLPLSEALRLPQSLHDDFADKSAAPHQLAMAVDISPTSSAWEDMTGASIAYGLTEGGSNAAQITLSDLGKRIVAPTEEGQEIAAKVQAALKPTVLRRFFDKYNRSKFPQEKIARNALAETGVPHDRLDKVLEILMQNGEYTGVIHQTKGGPFVAVDTPLPLADHDEEEEPETESNTDGQKAPAATTEVEEPARPATLTPTTTTTPKVFITHGKNEEIL